MSLKKLFKRLSPEPEKSPWDGYTLPKQYTQEELAEAVRGMHERITSLEPRRGLSAVQVLGALVAIIYALIYAGFIASQITSAYAVPVFLLGMPGILVFVHYLYLLGDKVFRGKEAKKA